MIVVPEPRPPPPSSHGSDESVVALLLPAGIAASSSPGMTTTTTTTTETDTTMTTSGGGGFASYADNGPSLSQSSMKSILPTRTMTVTLTPTSRGESKSSSFHNNIAAGVNLVELYSPVKAARTVMERKRRRDAAGAGLEREGWNENVTSAAAEVGIRFVDGTPTSSLDGGADNIYSCSGNNNNNNTPARKRLSLRPTNHITPITLTSTSTTTTAASAGSGTQGGGRIITGSNGDSVNRTWRIKIGDSPSDSLQDNITPPQEWMCQSCCSGGSIPSLAQACGNCRRKGYSHPRQLSSEPQQQHPRPPSSRTSIASAVTPTRGGAALGGEEALEIDVLDGDFDWNENEIGRAQMWQREHQQTLVESGGEEEISRATSTDAPSQTAPTILKKDGMGSGTSSSTGRSAANDFRAMLPIKEEDGKGDSNVRMILSQSSSSSSGSTKKKKKKKLRPPIHPPSTMLSQQQLVQYPIGHIHDATTTTMKMEQSTSSSSNQLLNHSSQAVIQNITQPFILYDENDDDHINAVHNIVRRDIWEGFVVGGVESDLSDNDTTPATTTSMTVATPVTSGDVNTKKEDCGGTTSDAAVAVTAEDVTSDNRSSSRLERYVGTIGFRCRFCKCAPASKRAEKSAVYPRSLERIYLSNIRFQRDHILQCTYIPKEISELYTRLKLSKGVTRGKKKYWVTSAVQRGLCNGENGIVFSQRAKLPS